MTNNERLDSWKEIAAYLKRGVRTVQRWERVAGLPVRRVPSTRGAVYAFRAELDEGYFALVSHGSGSAEQVHELPLEADLVILRRPIAGG